MSGIFGILDQQGIETEKLEAVSASIAHRGPDDEGYVLFTDSKPHEYSGEDTTGDLRLLRIGSAEKQKYQAALLHRRLATIDLNPTGHQPMGYRQGDLWIVFDGAIYNHVELRQELLTFGHRFIGSSDTEVILAAYCEWGRDCVNRFNGMWALAIWDDKQKELFLSRDRFAEKPLYYYQKDSRFIFASEIKAIRAYLNHDLPIAAGVERYARLLEYQVGQTDETMFADVVQLRHGHSLVFKNDAVRMERYYAYPIHESRRTLGENIEIFQELFLDSLKLRFRADVEVGACLSGGQDSSAIVSFASARLDRKITTVSSVFPGFKSDESSYIDAVIARHGCKATKFVPDISDLFAVTDREIWHQECPIDQINSLTQWYVMEKAKAIGLKVVLDGQGSDELLAGYPPLLRTYFIEMLRHLRFAEVLRHRPVYERWGYFKVKPLLRIVKAYGLAKLDKGKRATAFSDLNEQLKYMMDVSSIPYFFHFGDRAAAAHSVEDRCPFVDHRIVEFMFTVPSRQKIGNSALKHLLREAMREYIPREVYERTSKTGQMSITPIEVKFNAELSRHFDPETVDCLKRYNVISAYEDIKGLPIKTQFKYYTLARFIKLFA